MSLFQDIWGKRDAFRAAFWRDKWRNADGSASPNTKAVLNTLRPFCRADTSCVQFAKDGHIDTHLTAVMEGRREVFLEICRVLNLSDRELLAIKGNEDD